MTDDTRCDHSFAREINRIKSNAEEKCLNLSRRVASRRVFSLSYAGQIRVAREQRASRIHALGSNPHVAISA